MSSPTTTVAFSMTVYRHHPDCTCCDALMPCETEEVQRHIIAHVDGEDVRLLAVSDENGRTLKLGELSKQEQERALDEADLVATKDEVANA